MLMVFSGHSLLARSQFGMVCTFLPQHAFEAELSSCQAVHVFALVCPALLPVCGAIVPAAPANDQTQVPHSFQGGLPFFAN